MEICTIYLLVLNVFLLALASLSIPAIASADVAVLNPSFEIPAPDPLSSCGAGCSFSISPPPFWTLTGTGGELHPGSPSGGFLNPVPDGRSVAYVSGGTISQVAGKVTNAGTLFSLQVEVGLRATPGAGVGAVKLIVGERIITATGDAPAPGTFSTFSTAYLSEAADIGKPLTIQLTSPGALQATFDNVRLTVIGDAFQIRSLDNFQEGGVLNFTNTRSTRGDLCVNVYVFDEWEEMIGCCSCPVNANGVATVEASDLLGNNRSADSSVSVEVKLVATLADGPNRTCDPGTAGTPAAPLTSGLRAWATRWNWDSSVIKAAVPTDRFAGGHLTASELNHLTSFCNFIEANASNRGMCPTCAPGAFASARP